MHAVVSNLMASLLLIHAVLGCCWHSGHACEGRERVNCQAVKKTCCHHCHHEQQREKPPVPCKCRLECKGVCTYVPTERIVIDGAQLANSWQLLVVLPMKLETQCVQSSFRAYAGGPILLKPPLRLHLMHQIILI